MEFAYQCDTDGIIVLLHQQRHYGRGQQEEDKGILVEALEELHVNGFVILDLELVGAVTEPSGVGLLGGQAAGQACLELHGGLFGGPPGESSRWCGHCLGSHCGVLVLGLWKRVKEGKKDGCRVVPP